MFSLAEETMPSGTLSEQCAIIFGGCGSERYVSVATAQEFSTHLPEAQLWFLSPHGSYFRIRSDEIQRHAHPFEEPFEPTSGPFATNMVGMLREAQLHSMVLVIALHGTDAEDGEFAAVCERSHIPFTGSGSRASARAFDKAAAKQIAAEAGVRVLPSFIRTAEVHSPPPNVSSWVTDGYGIFAKPLRDGSSNGIQVLDSLEKLNQFFAAPVDRSYLLEPLAVGREATVGVIDTPTGARGLEPVEIRLPVGSRFDYQTKYLDSRVQELCPSTFLTTVRDALKAAAVSAHVAIGAQGYSRSDFIVQSGAQPIFLEINTLPGMTRSSLFPRELAVEGTSIRDFLVSQVERARLRTGSSLITTSESR
jgi:D-alanine-D-alanine ligase